MKAVDFLARLQHAGFIAFTLLGPSFHGTGHRDALRFHGDNLFPNRKQALIHRQDRNPVIIHIRVDFIPLRLFIPAADLAGGNRLAESRDFIFQYACPRAAVASLLFQGPGSLGQADDNMAIMNYYHLIRYESDPDLLSMYYNSFHWYWNNEKYERNPFFNFVYAACCLGKSRSDQWGTRDLTPDIAWMEMAADTLKRYPLDLIDWPMSNAHRIDLVYLGDHTRSPGTPVTGAGHRNDGLVYPIDENHAVYWGDDPWTLSSDGDGARMRDPVSFLVAYYLGVVHGFIGE